MTFAPAHARVRKLRIRPRRSSTLVVACLAAGALFTATGTGLAISGLAAPGPAVRAQYPDAKDLSRQEGSGAAPRPISLIDLAREHAARNSPERRADEARVEEEIQAALPTPDRASIRGYGSIPLLVAGIGLLAVGAFLRARRSGAPAQP
jgi:hypothetical protein